ncbi:hypothetical protein [Tautonia plasticadhaerens]|uniref:Uncharacterized protein n=1 Tax=Tautonia plasticadhaerens TaxID=2527974 RepID=A0A518HD52_9BACT|nr:hypothetical protein [Tautonia plasticadhaerens]QDV38784.1 hypothetical protein ElP_67410 [Tautonia plasticadhaerens]
MARGATRTRKARLGLEPLEGRRLLDGALAFEVGTPTGSIDPAAAELLPTAPAGVEAQSGAADAGSGATDAEGPGVRVLQAQAAQNAPPTPPPVKNLRYTTPRGVRVAVNLTGPGTLAGSNVRPDGTLDLVYDGTGPSSQIISHATGFAPLGSARDADVPINAQAGSGANAVGLAGLRVFDLVDGGTVNFIGGVRKLQLNNVGRNTEVFLRELPEVAAARAANAGRDLTLQEDQQGGLSLVLTDGNFFPVFQVEGVSEEQLNEPPPGIRIQVNRILADPVVNGDIGNPQFFGYDPAAGQLVRFDAISGAVLQAIDAPSVADGAGVSLTDLNGRPVVLLGQGSLVRVFDASGGALVGSFTTDNLAGFDSIDGIGTTDTRTVLVDAEADGPGVAQGVNIAASLASGVAVATTTPFEPTREFDFLGGATGTPGFDPLAVLGRGFFDEFQPNTEILGAMELDTTGPRLDELDRVGAPGLPDAPPAGTDEALGSIDQLVARVVGVADGRNVVNLVNRNTLGFAGTVLLNYPNRLAGLSESFRPSLAGKAVFDIQGDVQAFLANDARGLVLNDLGTLYLLGIGRARDSFVAGFPVAHVFLGQRQNVRIISPVIRGGTRGGVELIPNLQPLGPLFIP